MKGHVVKVQSMPERAIRQRRKSGRRVKSCAQDGSFRMTTGVFDKCGNDLTRGLSMSGQGDADGIEKRSLCLGHRTAGKLFRGGFRYQVGKLFVYRRWAF